MGGAISARVPECVQWALGVSFQKGQKNDQFVSQKFVRSLSRFLGLIANRLVDLIFEKKSIISSRSILINRTTKRRENNTKY